MVFFYKLAEVFQMSVAIRSVLPITLICVALSAVAGYVTRTKETFLGLLAVIGGGMQLAIYACSMIAQATAICWGCFALFSGISYLGLTSAFAIRKKIRERKHNREQILRKLQFTLPEKDNTYIRDRLNTILKIEEKQSNATENESEPLRLEHVRKMLAKVKEAPLTQAERIEAEEMSKMFSAYLKKNKWTPSDVRIMNELFSCLLKLSAKYSV